MLEEKAVREDTGAVSRGPFWERTQRSLRLVANEQTALRLPQKVRRWVDDLERTTGSKRPQSWKLSSLMVAVVFVVCLARTTVADYTVAH